jgi:hypothetical protein
MKNKDTEKLQKSGASCVTHKETKVRNVKSTISVEQVSEKQLQQSDSAQYITDSILVFTSLGVELGNLLTQRQRKLCLNSPIGY